jgi:C4-dicarboxylate transporter, DctQ subunit
MRNVLLGFFIFVFAATLTYSIYLFVRGLFRDGIGLNSLVKSVDSALTYFENWTLFIAVMVGLISLFFNVVLRYGFNYSLNWSEELIREIIIFTTFIGCSAAIKNRNMITIDALPQLVPRLKIPLNYFSHAVTIFYSIVISLLGWQMAIQQAQTSQKTITLQIPLVVLYVILPLMGAMMFIRTLQAIYLDIHSHFIGKKETG